MPQSTGASKVALIDEAAGLTVADPRAGQDHAAADFTRAFYRNAPRADIATRSAAELSEAALSLWRFAAQRRPGAPAIRFVPLGDAGPRRTRGVLQIVNEDMPFLVDSVSAALAGFGLEVGLVIHPVLTVRRDAGGHLAGFAPDPAPGHPAEGTSESMMHVEVEGRLDEARTAAVIKRLEAVLADVRSVFADAAVMRGFAARLAHECRAATATADGVETAEFVKWLDEENFLFFGTREYTLADGVLAVDPGSGSALLRDDSTRVFGAPGAPTRISPDVRAFLDAPRLAMVLKATTRSTVHRPVALDAILVKRLDRAGAVTGLRLLLGLFTAAAYVRPPQDVPLLRVKVRGVEARSGFLPESHDGKALRHILGTFPRDELFGIDEERLLETALGILYLRQRPRTALFVLNDSFRRFATCLVYLPRDRYSAEVRRRVAAILEAAFGGRVASDSTHFDETVLARMDFVLTLDGGHAGEVDLAAVERRLADASRAWADRLSEALLREGTRADDALNRYAAAFPSNYTERFSAATAVRDIDVLDALARGAPIVTELSVDPAAGGGLRLKTYHRADPVALSDILPMLENIGLRVLNETPYRVQARGAEVAAWIQEFELLGPAGVDVAEAAGRFADVLRDVWTGAAEDDGFNALVLTAGLSAREIVVLRTYCKLLRQVGTGSTGQGDMEQALARHPAIARGLVRLFAAQFDPAMEAGRRGALAATIHGEVEAALGAVENGEEDRILRAFLTLVRHTLRTNVHQRGADGAPKAYLSIKLASRDIDMLPRPRPHVEVFVYSPRMEGCHLRGGKVARGGIRWSDRRNDFRTEVLGLMKAQMVKNSVIVPVGSKGGFVVKRSIAERDALMAEVVACYRILMSGLLDLTDTIRGDAVVPPPDVVRRDGDDTYLVVAADKGTATFSDIANAVADDYGFWLGDAFASGGSVGYDHKAMGITARGAWEAVKRHFREVGTDIQAEDFTCVGVGDMSGDVFGNGMLLSRRTRLVAAFNHLHIFIDPEPDAARSWAERRRLFDLPRSSWRDYDPATLSAGGGVYDRAAKSIALSPEARRRLGVEAPTITPAQLVRHLLTLDVDLLWFGGIGTYVKASHEGDADAGDRVNDAVRVDASALRARVVGEGANLAITQRARIEYALAGGHINTDAIDNSAGVDTSDHEVNIKIAVGDAIAAGRLAPAERAAFLAAMTEEVGHLVLRDNHLQTLAITLIEAQAAERLDAHVRLMVGLEKRGKLDRAVEFLPDEAAVARRRSAGRGLTRPEIAVLLAYAKNVLYDELLASTLPDEPVLRPALLGYFPERLRALAPDALIAHRLRREIIATLTANDLVNRMGPSFVEETKRQTGREAAAIATAALVAGGVLNLPAVWEEVAALDDAASAAVQTQLSLAVAASVEQVVRWFLLAGLPLDAEALTRRFGAGVTELAPLLPDLLPEAERQANAERRAELVDAGAPPALAERVVTLATLAGALDIVQLADELGEGVASVAGRYFAAGATSGLLMLRRKARAVPATTEWQRLAATDLIDETYAQQRDIVRRTGAGAPREPTADAMLDDLLAEVARTVPPDLAMLAVASRRIRAATA